MRGRAGGRGARRRWFGQRDRGAGAAALISRRSALGRDGGSSGNGRARVRSYRSQSARQAFLRSAHSRAAWEGRSETSRRTLGGGRSVDVPSGTEAERVVRTRALGRDREGRRAGTERGR